MSWSLTWTSRSTSNHDIYPLDKLPAPKIFHRWIKRWIKVRDNSDCYFLFCRLRSFVGNFPSFFL